MILINLPEKIAIAVSGGRDSMALLHMAYVQLGSHNIVALTVDHVLRPESATEASQVQQWCAQHNIAHHTLIWHKQPHTKTSQAAARQARYALLAEWCYQNNVSTICTAHTHNDVAETFLARSLRQGHVGSYASMPSTRVLQHFYTSAHTAPHSVYLHRPLLQTTRQEITAYCQQHNVPFVDDPSNSNIKFERVQHRQFLATQPDLAKRMVALAQTLRIIENTWQAQATNFIQTHSMFYYAHGCASVPQDFWQDQNPELQYRILQQLIYAVRGQKPHMLWQALHPQLPKLLHGTTINVGGCVITPHQSHIFVCREDRFLLNPITLQPGLNVYDNRWLIDCPAPLVGSTLGALGESAWRRLKIKALAHMPLVANYTQLAVNGQPCLDFPALHATLKPLHTTIV